MNKFIIKVAVLMEGMPENATLEIIVFADSIEDAETLFSVIYSGMTGPAFSHTISQE